jgi:hypothetical protein
MPGNTGQMSGLLGISVTEVVLRGCEVGALVGEVVAAAVARGPGATEPRLFAGNWDDLVGGLAGHRRLRSGHDEGDGRGRVARRFDRWHVGAHGHVDLVGSEFDELQR